MRTFSTTSGRQVFVLSAALAFLSHATIAVSQNIDSHVDHSELNTQDHAENVEQPAAPQETHTDHSQHTAPLQDAATTQIDHSAHQPAIQQESLFMEEAVSNLRDPHTYSGGFTRSSGVYALPLEEQLSLADEANFQRLM
ncbi:MAG: hypothetical protein JKY29_14040, partial [Gammaproteobacteria bacterium]|nr:hypothetical protein [Gammaproteobacteria bacterium]